MRDPNNPTYPQSCYAPYLISPPSDRITLCTTTTDQVVKITTTIPIHFTTQPSKASTTTTATTQQPSPSTLDEFPQTTIFKTKLVPTCTNSLIEFSNSYICPLTNTAHVPPCTQARALVLCQLVFHTYVRTDKNYYLSYISTTNQQSTHVTVSSLTLDTYFDTPLYKPYRTDLSIHSDIIQLQACHQTVS